MLRDLGDVIRLDYSAYPNITRWLADMKALPYWNNTQEVFYQPLRRRV